MNASILHHLDALPSAKNITRVVTANGITVLIRQNFNSPTLSIKGYVMSGSIFDPDDKLGLSYLTASGLMTGTTQRDFQSIYNEIESIGASMGFSSGTLTTSFSAHCLSEDLASILQLMADSLRNPVFPKKEFNRQKNQMLTALKIRSQDTSEMAALLFDEIIYAGHPYQRPDEGYEETIQAIKREDLAEFYQSHYGPRGMVIVIVGAVDPTAAVDAIKQALGDWENPHQAFMPEIPPATALLETIRKNHSIPGKSQVDLVMGGLAPDRYSPDYQTLRVGNNILGEFGMMGRIGQRVREESGLAYYAYSSLSISLGPGAWELIAGVNPKNLEQCIELMTDEVRKFVSEPVTEDELADSKSYFLGRMPLLLESNSGVAISLLNIEHFNLGLDYFLHYPELVQAVTAEEILQASRKYLDPDRLAIAVSGP
jgi:zinc protease